MTKNMFHILGSVLTLLAFLLIVVGLQGMPWLWQAGLAVLAAGMLASMATRWAKKGSQDRN